MNADIDISGVTLETERLRIRPWTFDDLEDFFEYASADGVGQMAGWKPHGSREESRKILEGFIANKNQFALEYKENSKVIGSLGIEKYNPKVYEDEGKSEDLYISLKEGRGRELGYVLGRDYWGRGLMTEAVQRVIKYCFEDLKLDFLTVGHFVQNGRSRRVIEKCGFVFFGESVFKTMMGTTEQDMTYLLTASRWRENVY